MKTGKSLALLIGMIAPGIVPAHAVRAADYRLNYVRSGPVTLEIFYTGLDAQEILLELSAGATIPFRSWPRY